ncbi:sugar phosphate isomerase/epimerase family protein [Agromyces kandeliae]|uniref:TIM barrel protein n=1 Tax=Agromyces kandeliae TaxID=2666141 RepID=A0A6L5R5M6_9MICO|nr:sugar phosphate isomerase/epimerase [Agromyces kandeliae]MRX45279.1 TIM barrel protein [Agromyces kandeliae]
MIRIGMSTTCVYPLEPEHAFRIAKDAGFDGVEIMVTQEATTQDPAALIEMSERYELPILSIHAPVLLLTHFVWGRDPRIKLARTAELAKAVGADSVVVHPPFRWQASYALEFLSIVRTLSEEHGVAIAVENMFPWRAAGRNMKAYAPGWDPRQMDCDAVTLDFSHAALSGTDSMQLATDLGERLRHVHLCDGSGAIGEGQIFDEHLLPGRGKEPVAEVLRMLADRGWDGAVVAEVNTRKAKTEAERLEMLRETVAFAREHTAVAAGVPTPEPAHGSPLRRVIDAIIPGRNS